VRIVPAERVGALNVEAEAVILRPDAYCAGCLTSDDPTELEVALRLLTCR
jgi:hypothetical protein